MSTHQVMAVVSLRQLSVDKIGANQFSVSNLIINFNFISLTIVLLEISC
jgi:hypothetical protein